ncbi:serine hydrolase [Arthrobacter sp. ZGTC131]|uniref:serine hydrolase domain-containing protein n=1 Tax=Arthrobacter sp. ZGTC131 TaxID=2058898 RepID=UPI000CE50CF0|nr:serine hydrolase domain-containing protein [Arthrobacter sp. ZGTC131]
MPGTRPRTSRLRPTAFVAAAALAALTGGCTAAPDQPEETSASAAAFADLEQFGRTMIENGAPAVLMHAKNNGEEWSRAVGVRSLEAKEPVQLSDPVQVASVTKSMVAVSVLKLVEEGRLKLDEAVSEYLPDFGRVVHPPLPVTIRDLLGHSSGMPDYEHALLESKPLKDVIHTRLSLTERLAWAGKTTWEKRLAQGFNYSNSNYVALGLLVEKLRGRPIGDVINSEITSPLGMTGTFMSGARAAPSGMVHGYLVIEDKTVDVTNPEVVIGSPSGGMVSTVQDLNSFYSALLQGKLLKPAMLKEMQTNDFAGFYGLGLWIWNDTCTNDFAYGHPGDLLGYGTVSITSADGTRQVTVALTYPPAPFVAGENPLVLEMMDVAENTLNSMC